MKKNIRLYAIYTLLLIILCLLIFGIFYAIKNYNKGEVMILNDINIKKTINSNQLDAIKLPTVNLPLIYDKLPETKETVQEIEYKTFNKLFQTKGKSVLILIKDDCTNCNEYISVLNNTLSEININAYLINVSKLSNKNNKDIYNYIDYGTTPTTYIISNGSAKHSLTGSVDKETLKAFIDYFYTRDN